MGSRPVGGESETDQTAGKLRLALGTAEELSPRVTAGKAERVEGEVKAR